MTQQWPELIIDAFHPQVKIGGMTPHTPAEQALSLQITHKPRSE